MKKLRLIARLDIKAPKLIKGINLEGVRALGDPEIFSEQYYDDGVDEILYVDAVATLYERNSLADLVKSTADKVFVPMTICGGLRTLDDVHAMLRAGADKVAINTAAINNPKLISDVAKCFGNQCMVLSVEAKRYGANKWEAYTDNGRNKTGKDVIDWIKEAVDLGVGEILLTSVDQEGTANGFDYKLIEAVSNVVNIPIIASGGMGKLEHAVQAAHSGADAIAMAHVLHYKEFTLAQVREHLKQAGFAIRG